MVDGWDLFYGIVLILFAIGIRFSRHYRRGVDLAKIVFPVLIFLGVCFVAYYVAVRAGLILAG